MSAAERFIVGTASEADLDQLRQALLDWITDTDKGPQLQARIGITRRSARTALRNQHLRAAGRHLSGERWQRATALADLTRAFLIRRWQRYQRTGLPADASPIDRELFQARRFAEIDLSPRALFDIID